MRIPLVVLLLVTFASPLLNSPAMAQTAPSQPSAQDIVRLSRTSEGHAVVSIRVPSAHGGSDAMDATFDFGESEGFVGPSSDPTRQQAFTNSDATLIAVAHQPATKSSDVYLFLRSLGGDLIVNPINIRVARLLKGTWAEAAKGFLRVESISGRRVHLQVLDFATARGDQCNFTIDVDPDGTLALAK